MVRIEVLTSQILSGETELSAPFCGGRGVVEKNPFKKINSIPCPYLSLFLTDGTMKVRNDDEIFTR